MNEQVAAQPLTDEDRHEQVKYAQECVKRRPGKFDECFDCSTILQWDATLRAVEEERDALKEELAKVSADRDSWRSVTRYD